MIILNLSLLWSSCLGMLAYLLPVMSKLFGFQIFWLSAYLMKVIIETSQNNYQD
jgi:hypothetical protein